MQKELEDKDIELHIDRETLLQEYIPRAEFEARLKADMVAMLEELDLQIEEMNTSHLSNDALAGFRWGRYCIRENIQQKINALKGAEK